VQRIAALMFPSFDELVHRVSIDAVQSYGETVPKCQDSEEGRADERLSPGCVLHLSAFDKTLLCICLVLMADVPYKLTIHCRCMKVQALMHLKAQRLEGCVLV
jgi:hypothetical protein